MSFICVCMCAHACVCAHIFTGVSLFCNFVCKCISWRQLCVRDGACNSHRSKWPNMLQNCEGSLRAISLHEFTCISVLLYLEGLDFILFFILSGFYSLSFFLFIGLPCTLIVGTLWRYAIKPECSAVSHSLHIVQLWVSVLISIYCKSELL